tara:strand:+ start:3499 stop:4407 length:909 start_codon:yes stop_codon:yes gene_type:complete
MKAMMQPLKAIAAGLAVVAASAFPANASGNVLRIVQEGNDNSLIVDQSAASNSSVNGLVLNQSPDNFIVYDGDTDPRDHKYHGMRHGDGRYWWKKWHSDFKSRSDMRNSFDFSGHHGRGYGGHHHDGPSAGDSEETISFERLSAVQDGGNPALQQGSGNSASIVIEGNGGQVGLLQSNPITGFGHNANISVYGSGSALVGQLGDNNTAFLTVVGGSGAVLQDGIGNHANLSVGGGSTGLISQIGNSNVTSLEVPSGGANVSYLVYGNGLTGSTPAEVMSNAPGKVVIRQYQFGFALMPGGGS